MSAIVVYPNDGTVSYTIGATPPAGSLAIDFPYFFPDEITVTRIVGLGVVGAVPVYTPLFADDDYTLVGTPADDGFHSGAVTMILVVTNCTIRIDRTLRADKMHNFPETGAISIAGMNTQFSRLWSWIQDLARRQSQVVGDALSAYLPLAGGTMGGHIVLPTGPAAANAVRKDYVDAADASLQSQVNLKAPIFDPTFTGTPDAPTPLSTDVPSTRIATTAYVRNLLATRGQGEGIWTYRGATLAAPVSGGFIIDPGTLPAHQIAIHKTDADSVGRYLLLLRPGDSVVVTSEFTPITSYARFDISGTVVDHGTWVEFPAVLTSSASFAPVVATRYMLSGFLNTAAGIDPITAVIAGTGLVGGGTAGAVTLALASTNAKLGLVGEHQPAGNTAQLLVNWPVASKIVEVSWSVRQVGAVDQIQWMDFAVDATFPAHTYTMIQNMGGTNVVDGGGGTAGSHGSWRYETFGIRLGAFSYTSGSMRIYKQGSGSIWAVGNYHGRASVDGYETATTFSAAVTDAAFPNVNGMRIYNGASTSFVGPDSWIRCVAL
jgi:hypothetical protein